MFGRYRIASTPTTPVAQSFRSPTFCPSPVGLATPTPSQPASKRKRVHLEADKENTLPTIGPPTKKPYTPRRDPKQKLDTIFQALAEVNWTLPEFLYQLFRTKDEDGKDIQRTDRHAKYVQHFLQGTGKYTPGRILRGSDTIDTVRERRPASAVSCTLTPAGNKCEIDDVHLPRSLHMSSLPSTSHGTTRQDCCHLHAVFSTSHFLHLSIYLLTAVALAKCQLTAPSRVL